MAWALITHPAHLALFEQGTSILPTAIQERDLHWALGQGWIVLGRDSDIAAAAIEENLQSNPQRARHWGHGCGAVDDDGA